jgi:LysM repeat protein
MKQTLLFATLSMVLALPQSFGATELEALRARCAAQERQIRDLEEQVVELQSGTSRHSSRLASTSPVTSLSSSTMATHTVVAGESMERIARRVGISTEQLAKANGMKLSSVIHPGQKLKVPGPSVVQAPTQEVAPTRAPVISNPAFAGKTHTVRAGDTFSGISKKYGISIASLAAANPKAKTTALRPGQVLRLSTGAAASSPASAPAATQARSATQLATAPRASATPRGTTSATSPTVAASTGTSSQARATEPKVAKSLPASTTTTVSTTPAAAPTAGTAAAKSPSQEQTLSPTNPEKKIRSVTIEGEMTYGEFAATHGTDTARLNDLNGLDLTHATVLAKGSELYVPAQP